MSLRTLNQYRTLLYGRSGSRDFFLTITLRDIQRLPRTLFSLLLRKHPDLRETLAQYTTFNRGGGKGVCSLVLCSLAIVLSCIYPSVRIVTKSPKVGPVLYLYSPSLWLHFMNMWYESELQLLALLTFVLYLWQDRWVWWRGKTISAVTMNVKATGIMGTTSQPRMRPKERSPHHHFYHLIYKALQSWTQRTGIFVVPPLKWMIFWLMRKVAICFKRSQIFLCCGCGSRIHNTGIARKLTKICK